MTRRPRNLTPEERELWSRVAGTAHALHPLATPPGAEKPAAAKVQQPRPRPPLTEFQIGEAVRPRPWGHDLQPHLEDRLRAQPVHMDRKAHQQMTRGRMVPEARIDLHGMTLTEAHPALIRFVLDAHAAGKRLVLVITGKGKARDDFDPIPQRLGVLRHQVPHWLAQPPLGQAVLQLAPAHWKHGGVGAYYVYLRRPHG